MDSPTSSKGKKRDRDFSVNEDHSPQASTPSNSPIPGAVSSPARKRLNLDFWNPKKEEKVDETLSTEAVTIAKLEVGLVLNKPLLCRVSLKSDRVTRNNRKMTMMHVLDDVDEISVVVFPVQTAHLHLDLQINKVYELRNFEVKNRSPDYTSETEHPLQIILTNDSVFAEVDSSRCRRIPFKMTGLDEIESTEVSSVIDTVGVLIDCEGFVTLANGQCKRDIAVTDKSKTVMKVTIWDEAAKKFNVEQFSVIALRNAVVSKYNETKYLNCSRRTLIWDNPEIEEMDALTTWFQKALQEKNDPAVQD